MRRTVRATVVIAAFALVLAACGSSKKTTTSAGAATATTAAPAASAGGNAYGAYGGDQSTQGTTAAATTTGAQVRVADSKLGKILVDGAGRTLYAFDADKGTTSACTGACAANWPALTSDGAPVAGAGVDASKLGTAKQADGADQVTYNGRLLYHFAGDKQPGDTNGQGIKGVWHALAPSGDAVM